MLNHRSSSSHSMTMMFFFAFVLALVSVAYSAPVFTFTPPSGSVYFGQRFDLTFSSDEAITVASPVTFDATFTQQKKVLSLAGMQNSPANVILCHLKADATVNVGFYYSTDDKMTFTSTAAIDANAEFVCPSRLAFSQIKTSSVVEIQVSGVKSTITTAPLPDTAKFSIEKGDSDYKAVFSLEGYPKDVIVGPFNFYVGSSASFENELQVTSDILRYQFWNEDGANHKASIGGGYRFVVLNTSQLFILTSPTDAPTKASFTIQFPESNILSGIKAAIGKSIYFGAKYYKSNAGEDAKVDIAVEGPKIPELTVSATAQTTVSEDGKTIYYSFSLPVASMDKPVVEVKFDSKFDLAADIFASGSKLGYSVNAGSRTDLTFPGVDGGAKWELTTVKKGDTNIVIDGSFSVDSKAFSEFKVSFDADSQSGSAQLKASFSIKDVTIKAAKTDALDFTFEAEANKYFQLSKDAMDVDIYFPIKYSLGVDSAISGKIPFGDIRANSKFLPECTIQGDANSGVKLEAMSGLVSDVDTGDHYIRVTGSVSDPTVNISVSCTHALNKGLKAAKKLQVAIGAKVSAAFTAAWDLVSIFTSIIDALVNYDHVITVFAPEIKTSADWKNIIDKTKAFLGTALTGELFIVVSGQPVLYSSSIVSLDYVFDSENILYPGKLSSKISFAFKKAPLVTLNNNYSVVDGIGYLVYDNDVALLKCVKSSDFVDGNNDDSYGNLQSIPQGEGFACFSSNQCVGFSGKLHQDDGFDTQLWCYKGACTHYSALPQASQQAVDSGYHPDDEGEPSSAYLASAAAVFVAMFLAILF